MNEVQGIASIAESKTSKLSFKGVEAGASQESKKNPYGPTR